MFAEKLSSLNIIVTVVIKRVMCGNHITIEHFYVMEAKNYRKILWQSTCLKGIKKLFHFYVVLTKILRSFEMFAEKSSSTL